MPRNYKRKTNRANISDDQLKNAVLLVNGGMSIRNAARTSGVNRMTLARYLANNQRGYEKNRDLHRVFTDAEEKSLADHIKQLDDCFHGLSKDKCRKLAHDFALANQIKVPSSWKSHGLTGGCFLLMILILFLKQGK